MDNDLTYTPTPDEFEALNNVDITATTTNTSPLGCDIESFTITGNKHDLQMLNYFFTHARTKYKYTLELNSPGKIFGLYKFIKQALDDNGDLYEGSDIAKEVMKDIVEAINER